MSFSLQQHLILSLAQQKCPDHIFLGSSSGGVTSADSRRTQAMRPPNSTALSLGCTAGNGPRTCGDSTGCLFRAAGGMGNSVTTLHGKGGQGSVRTVCVLGCLCLQPHRPVARCSICSLTLLHQPSEFSAQTEGGRHFLCKWPY